MITTEARNQIRTSFASDISSSSIAHELGCNSDYLGRVYKRSFNSTITEDINSARLNYAKKLLLSGKLRVEEIMDASGFNDPAYFRRSFRKKFNMTPGRFRKVCACYHVNTEQNPQDPLSRNVHQIYSLIQGFFAYQVNSMKSSVFYQFLRAFLLYLCIHFLQHARFNFGES